jgi:hypothetical protein
VQFYWNTRDEQRDKQKDRGRISDAGTRSAVTGGKQMAEMERLFSEIIEGTGLPESSIQVQKRLELPGFYRAEKKWDLLVVDRGQLVAALEFKSQAGPSFGNNFNNRSEEAIGSPSDLLLAYREGRVGPMRAFRPFLGYFFLLEDCPEVHKAIGVSEPNFPVDPIFRDGSYAKRYEILCSRLVSERLYDAACLTLAPASSSTSVCHPTSDLAFLPFVQAIQAHCVRWLQIR